MFLLDKLSTITAILNKKKRKNGVKTVMSTLGVEKRTSSGDKFLTLLKENCQLSLMDSR